MLTKIEDRPTIVSIRTMDLNAATRSEIIQVCTTAHDNPEFQRLFSYLPPDGLHVLAYSRAQLVSHAVITTRWLQAGRSPMLRTAYVDALSTARDFQGRKFGSNVMRHVAELSNEAYEIACLETERIHFFKRLGWQEWRGPLAGRRNGDLVPTPQQTGIMILRLHRTPPLNVFGLLTIECQADRIW